MVPEAPLEQTEHGLAAGGEGWFVVNARETGWWERPGRGFFCELEDAIECANAALDDDTRVSVQDGRSANAEPFAREELLKPLERWFFGRA